MSAKITRLARRSSIALPTKNTVASIDAGQHSPASVANTIAFITCTLEDMQGKISLNDWLDNFVALTGADYAASERWSNGEPERSKTAATGSGDPLRTGWRNWVDHVMETEREDRSLFLDTTSSGKRVALPLDDGIPASEVIMYSLAWYPTRIIGVLRKTGGDEAWNARTRELLELLIPNMRESVVLHKLFTRIGTLADLTVDILDAAPRGIIALSPDGIIRYSNAFGESLLADNDGISRNGTQFCISDKECLPTFEEKLELIGNCKTEEIEKQIWHVTITRPSGHGSYQMMVRGQLMRDWRIETARGNRIAVIYLHDPDHHQNPSFQQLKDFYGLTTAEAKLTAILYNGVSIAAASEQLGVSVNTSRTHLRNIFSKVGVKNQVELLAKLASSLR
ncbi:MAG: helix-turn-helix transcriptional regulator [Gammaproteobacteria bacterium]|nr:helix-turn-helix transcriptional regulator [Gammaproteobacteria bacterium]